jgi:hypothetical protein
MKPCGLFLILAMNLGFATISFGEETTANRAVNIRSGAGVWHGWQRTGREHKDRSQ